MFADIAGEFAVNVPVGCLVEERGDDRRGGEVAYGGVRRPFHDPHEKQGPCNAALEYCFAMELVDGDVEGLNVTGSVCEREGRHRGGSFAIQL